MELYKGPQIIEMANGKKIQWTVHVTTSEERSNIKSAIHMKIEGKRRIGRPRVDGLMALKV